MTEEQQQRTPLVDGWTLHESIGEPGTFVLRDPENNVRRFFGSEEAGMLRKMATRIMKLESALRVAQWCLGGSDHLEDMCPVCMGDRPFHENDCIVGLALGGE